MAYDYLEAVKNDVREYLEENDGAEYIAEYGVDRTIERLNDELWNVDSVTGNGSGSYTFDRQLAKQYVFEGGFPTLVDAIKEFGVDSELVAHNMLCEDWEWFDVTIRCYLLGQAVSEVVEEFAEKGGEEE